MKKIITVYQARAAKQLAFAKYEAAAETKAALQQEISTILAANPQVGVLIRKGKPVYYVNSPAYAEANSPAALI